MTQNPLTQEIEPRPGNGQLASAPRRVVTPPADILRKNDRIVLTLDLPGVDPASLSVTCAENALHVTAKARSQEAEVRGGVTYAEFEFGDYERTFRLDDRIDSAGIDAELVDGVLKIELPLVKPAQRRVTVRVA